MIVNINTPIRQQLLACVCDFMLNMATSLAEATSKWRIFSLNENQHMTHKKSLKIPKEWSEAVNGRRTDNTVAKRKKGEKHEQRSTKHYTEN